MALNIQTFKIRSLTAAVFVIVMLAGLFLNKWSFVALFTIIHFGCWCEFIKLIKKIYGSNYLPNAFFGLVYITMPVLMIINLGFYGDAYTQYSYLLPCAIIFSIWINDTMAYIVGSLIG